MSKYSELMKKKNVTFIGHGTKRAGGIDTGKPAIVVGVEKKEPLCALAAKDIVPKEVNGIETDVVEMGPFKALNDRALSFKET